MDHVDRRASLRITEVRDLFGALMPIGEPIDLLNLSRGGFALLSPFEFLVGNEHTFVFCLPAGHRIGVNGLTVHCDRAGADAIYRVGFSFVPATRKDELAITILADVAKIYVTPKRIARRRNGLELVRALRQDPPPTPAKAPAGGTSPARVISAPQQLRHRSDRKPRRKPSDS